MKSKNKDRNITFPNFVANMNKETLSHMPDNVHSSDIHILPSILQTEKLKLPWRC